VIVDLLIPQLKRKKRAAAKLDGATWDSPETARQTDRVNDQSAV